MIVFPQIFDVGESFSQLLVEGDSDDDDDSGTDDNTLMAIVKNVQGLKANDPKKYVLENDISMVTNQNRLSPF